MTIKEIETRAGMTRANIRFYEAEGLPRLRFRRRAEGRKPYGGRDTAGDEPAETVRRVVHDRRLRRTY